MCTKPIYHNSLGKFMDWEEFKHCSSHEAIRNKQMHVLTADAFFPCKSPFSGHHKTPTQYPEGGSADMTPRLKSEKLYK